MVDNKPLKLVVENGDAVIRAGCVKLAEGDDECTAFINRLLSQHENFKEYAEIANEGLAGWFRMLPDEDWTPEMGPDPDPLTEEGA